MSSRFVDRAVGIADGRPTGGAATLALSFLGRFFL